MGKSRRGRTVWGGIAGLALTMSVVVVWQRFGAGYGIATALALLVAFGDLLAAAWVNARVARAEPVAEMIGRRGVVVEGFRAGSGGCLGCVRIHGEFWRARGEPGRGAPLRPGTTVVVTGFTGARLEVRPEAPQGTTHESGQGR